MRRNTTILLVGALVAVLSIGALAPVASAHGSTDADEHASTPDAENATDAHAQYMAEWMTGRMGPEGVQAFEAETGTTIESVTNAMAEHMGPQVGPWQSDGAVRQFGPASGSEYRMPVGSHGPQMPFGNGVGPGTWDGFGPGMWNGAGPGMWNGFGPGSWGDSGPGGWGNSGPGSWGGAGPTEDGYGSGGHGMGGHGMGGHGMGGGW